MQDDLFIPPDGAMQFEITNPRAPGADKRPDLVMQAGPNPKVIWVEAETEANRKHTCNCPRLWVVILDSLPPKLRAQARERTERTGGHFTVCPCQGRLIE